MDSERRGSICFIIMFFHFFSCLWKTFSISSVAAIINIKNSKSCEVGEVIFIDFTCNFPNYGKKWKYLRKNGFCVISVFILYLHNMLKSIKKRNKHEQL